MSKLKTISINREKKIISLLQNKDQRALVMLYEHYSGALYHIILRIVKTEEIAKEVLQDVFVKIWEQGTSYDASKGKLYTWMARVTRNLSIDRLRSKTFKDGNRSEQLEDFVSNSIAFSDTPKFRDSGLQSVVNQLDDKYRHIIDYLYFQDYTQSEASKALNIPLGTIKSRSRLAIKALRKLLQNERLSSAILFFIIYKSMN